MAILLVEYVVKSRINQSIMNGLSPKVSKLWGERSDAEGELEDVLSRVEAIRWVLSSAADLDDFCLDP